MDPPCPELFIGSTVVGTSVLSLMSLATGGFFHQFGNVLATKIVEETLVQLSSSEVLVLSLWSSLLLGGGVGMGI